MGNESSGNHCGGQWLEQSCFLSFQIRGFEGPLSRAEKAHSHSTCKGWCQNQGWFTWALSRRKKYLLRLKWWWIMVFFRLNLSTLISRWLTVNIRCAESVVILSSGSSTGGSCPSAVCRQMCPSFIFPVSEWVLTLEMPFTQGRCWRLGQPIDVFTELGKVVYIFFPLLKIVGQNGLHLCVNPMVGMLVGFFRTCTIWYAKCWQLDLVLPYTHIQLFTLHKVGVTPHEVGHFTVDHTQNHGKCLFTWQNCGESSFRWGMGAKQKSEWCLPVLCKGNLFCAKAILLHRSLKSRHNCDLSPFYTSRTINVKMTQPHQEQPFYTVDKMAVDFQMGKAWHGCCKEAFLNLKSET